MKFELMKNIICSSNFEDEQNRTSGSEDMAKSVVKLIKLKLKLN